MLVLKVRLIIIGLVTMLEGLFSIRRVERPTGGNEKWLFELDEDEDVDEDESAEGVDDPDWLFPPVGVRVHDLVSRTRGSPLSPVMGSRVIVHFWIIGPVALVVKGADLRRHLPRKEEQYSRLEGLRHLHGGRLRQILSIPGHSQCRVRTLLRNSRSSICVTQKEQESEKESDSSRL